MSCGADTEATALLASLTAGVSFTVPTVNLDDPLYDVPGGADSALYQPVARLTGDQLTDGTTTGPGIFDVLMRGVAAQIKLEKDANRLSGAEYTKAYVALVQAAMASATQFLISEEAAFWQSETAQIAAITAKVVLEQEKVKYATLQIAALTAKAQYGLAEMQLATESMNYCTAKFNLENLLPLQQDGLTADNAAKTYNLNTTLPMQTQLGQAQLDGLGLDKQTKQYNLSSTLPAQLIQITEQANSLRAQSLDTRTDGAAVGGTAGAQKALYLQQIDSYKRDAESKVAKLFSDAWTVQKTMDEGVLPPNNFTNTSIDQVLTYIRSTNNIPT